MPLLTAPHYLNVGFIIQHLIQSKISPSPRLPLLIQFTPQGGEGGGDRLKVWRPGQRGTGGLLPPQLTSAS